MFDNLFEIGINISIGIEIPQCQAAQLVIIVPIIEQLIDMLLTSLIFLCLGVIQILCRDFTNHEGFHIGTVTFLGNLVRIVCYLQLGLLIIELFYKDKQILIEIHGFLT